MVDHERIAANNIVRWRRDPVAFVREQFKIEPDLWQKDFLRNYVNNIRSGAKACKGPGKTAVLAWCCWHFAICYRDSKIVATSITGENLRDGLWTELAKWQARSKLLKATFTWKAERITHNEHPETWYMAARKWSRSADTEQQANTLAGLHADYMMFVIDEAGGVPDAVMAAAEAALANAGTEVNPGAIAKLLICGNPTHLSGPLYRACTAEAKLWAMIEITGDPDDPKRSPRISKDWARAQIEKYGRDNPFVLVNVFGKFPPSSINALLGPDMVQAAMERVIPDSAWIYEAKILGVDVGGGAHDPTALCPRQGPVYFKPKLLRLEDPKQIAGHIAQAMNRWEPDMVNIDNTGGWGSGVISHLRDWGYNVNGVMFSEKATDQKLFYNKRTEMIHDFSMAVRDGACLPNIPALKAAACAQVYCHYKDKMLMEDKTELKQGISDTTGFDILDGYALTHAYPVAKHAALHRGRNLVQQDYNPVQEQQIQKTIVDYNPVS